VCKRGEFGSKNSLCLAHFGLILLTLVGRELQLLWVAQVFFRYCFLSALISERAVAIFPPFHEILLHCGVKIVCLLIENDFFLHPATLFICMPWAEGAMSLIKWQQDAGKVWRNSGRSKRLVICACSVECLCHQKVNLKSPACPSLQVFHLL